jgi:heptosyltransferase-2
MKLSALKNNKILVYAVDFFLRGLFFVPLFLDKIFRRKPRARKQSILIMELWGIGDLVMMSAILRPLRKKFPYARIILLSKAYGKEILANAGCIDEFIIFDFPWTRFKGKYKLWDWDWRGLTRIISRLRKEKINLAIDARGDIRNNLLSFFIGARERVGYNWTGGGCFLTKVVNFGRKNKHRIDAWQGLLKCLRIDSGNIKPAIGIAREEELEADKFLKQQGVKDGDLIIGIHPGAGVKLRCWPLDRFGKVAQYMIDKYQAKILVFIEPQGYGKDISIKGDWIKVEGSLKLLISVIKKIDLLICNDSSSMHMADALNKPVVAIFGPGDLAAIRPYGDKGELVFEQNMQCRPCFDYCRYREPVCLKKIEIEDVILAADKVIDRLD